MPLPTVTGAHPPAGPQGGLDVAWLWRAPPPQAAARVDDGIDGLGTLLGDGAHDEQLSARRVDQPHLRHRASLVDAELARPEPLVHIPVVGAVA